MIRCPVDCNPVNGDDRAVQEILEARYHNTPVGGLITIRDRIAQDSKYRYAVWKRIQGGWERKDGGWAVLAGGGSDDNWQLFPSYDVFNGIGARIIQWEVSVGDIFTP